MKGEYLWTAWARSGSPITGLCWWRDGSVHTAAAGWNVASGFSDVCLCVAEEKEEYPEKAYASHRDVRVLSKYSRRHIGNVDNGSSSPRPRTGRHSENPDATFHQPALV